MKSRLVIAAGLCALAAAPASGRQVDFQNVYRTLGQCMAVGELRDHWSHWSYLCLPTDDGGWELVWTNAKRGGGKK